MDDDRSVTTIKPKHTKMPTSVAVLVGVGLGVAIALTLKCLGEITGMWTIVGVWLSAGLIAFFTLPLEFFPQTSVESVPDGPLPSERKSRKTLPWLVRLVLTILLVPLILGGLSIRRTTPKKREPN